MVVATAASNSQKPAGVPYNPEEAHKAKLFEPITCKSVTLHNRVAVPPMCMYSAEDGALNDFHIAHYGSIAIRGAGLIIIEATAVEPQGRITPSDSGLWNDDQIEPLKRVVDLIRSQGSVPGLQIAHAGRKASMSPPFIGDFIVSDAEGGWADDVRGPSELKFADHYPAPKPLTKEGIKEMVQKWVDTAIRADKAGVEVLELHNAHGYLVHSFLSGNSNNRTDEYGGSLENRMRFPLEIARAVRAVWPDHKPLWVRISATDYANPDSLGHDENGWDVYQSIEYAKELKKIGVDVIDVSSGGHLSNVKYPPPSLYQVPLANAVKHGANIPTGAVGYIHTGKQAEEILEKDEADYILVGREYLRHPTWVMEAGNDLGVDLNFPKQYTWALRRARKTNKVKDDSN
ncbi:hypothetical protein J3Q64DRAFT_1757332 [Phycomyces blakesleeanus]|uniref:NADH:flavin oxidoreductase/NADH oxidase N-terminal domain-containing protein n=2 Tax=Phycomyces blakesleeanus TaxID=4837 RepID=A0A167REC8_PHYB8|nr:hypothetical protein PHYBLDRAFT_129702 [Phycomyces blakesleeanus NRRL 1555(-)]OAD81454.1 hypothetical protein PHYBLDRAFT_129702 [Phycomyces blakesleeanus NRRL 1555(-)]|eukprot:XP_018299494.1 hypothetical protein PHYBLDRAFT_129702 [Phycomyces blakesleeanus NRRL 1555(-)]